jgi:hypothetical protein
MKLPLRNSLKGMTEAELRAVVRALVGERRRLEAEKERLLRKQFMLALKKLSAEDELARLKKRPPQV